MKRIEKGSAVLVLAVGILILLLSCALRKPSADINDEMQHLLSGLAERDKSVKNCVLSVMKGDGSFAWSGAAGIANENIQAPMTKDTPIYIASVTKLYTATVIMRLSEKGALSLDDPMSRYLPAGLIRGIHVYKGKDYSREITIGQLLSNTSGIADYYTERPKGGKSVFESLLENPTRIWREDETIEWARDKLQPHFPPGTAAFYSDTNFDLLGKIIEAITGQPLHTVYEDIIFRPLGLTHTWLIDSSAPQTIIPISPADVFYIDRNITDMRSNSVYWPYMVSTAEEMIIFLKALNEGRIISGDSLKLMHNWHKLRFPLQYGYGTMYFKLPPLSTMVTDMHPLWGHSGSTGSFLYYSNDLNLYMAGTLDQVESPSKPFRLMARVMRVVKSRS
jgi:D-alanyl-D-alanine carboxypeptidase